jgi:hypothetical protein
LVFNKARHWPLAAVNVRATLPKKQQHNAMHVTGGIPKPGIDFLN